MQQTLKQNQFEDADLKHDNNIFEFQRKNTQTRQFRSQTCGFFVLHKTLESDKFEGVDFNMKIAFSNCSPKIPK